MKKTTASLLGAACTAAASASPLAFVITGESNSGGIGLNADATPAELQPRPAVRIMNLTDGRFGFEPLWLGKNNLREHAGLAAYYDNCHGLENGLAEAAETGAFAERAPVYLIKTGQGGSRIEEWAPGHPSGYWQKHMQRIEAAKRQLPGKTQWVVWMSLGINDAIAGTDMGLWQTAVVAHIRRLQAQLPGAIVVMTQFQAMGKYPALDAAIAAIAAREPGVRAVSSTDAVLRDENHWSCAGFKILAGRMVEATLRASAPSPAKNTEETKR
ncbi:MAG: sialate O-acetylesterase [Kiritimatiellae bacterium]|nr:sialate O-acetylesterase [Kiritimatiellia bacterium]